MASDKNLILSVKQPLAHPQGLVITGLDVEQCLGPASRGSCGIRTCR